MKNRKQKTENQENRKPIRAVFHFPFSVFGFLFSGSFAVWLRLVRVKA
jgi:hypothetical protein